MIPLGETISVVPRESCFWLEFLGFAIVTSIFSLTHPVRSEARLWLALFASVVCASYGALAMYVVESGWRYPFDFDPAFGFFINTNHTSALLVTGSMLVLGVMGVGMRLGYWTASAIAAACLTVCLTALFFFSRSRGGILFLAAGTLLWLAGLGKKHLSLPRIISFTAIFLAAVLLFLNSESEVRDRVLKLVGSAETLVKSPASVQTAENGAAPNWDARLFIFRDTLKLIRDFPLTGAGLGSFRFVFPFYREGFRSEGRCVHPESDWLMLAAEAGVPALFIAFATAIFLLRNSLALRNHPFWPLRWGMICAVMTASIHGFVDAPFHRVALGWWFLVIAGLGFQTPTLIRSGVSRLQTAVFIVAGICALALGVALIRAEWFGGKPLPPFEFSKALQEIQTLERNEQWWEAGEAARQATKFSPMEADLYFHVGASLIRFEETDAEVEAAFRAQRLLNPVWTVIPYEQGRMWMNVDQKRAADLWLDAVRRRQYVDRNDRVALEWFGQLITQAAKYPILQEELFAASAKGPEFTLKWLERAETPLVAGKMPGLAADESFLSALSDANRRRFLRAWYKVDRDGPFQFVAARPDWEAADSSLQIRRLVDAGKFEEGVRFACERYKVHLDLPAKSDEDVEKTVSESDPVNAFEHYWNAGNVVTARRILDEAAAKPVVNPEIWRLKAAVSASERDWRNAWQYVERYLRATRSDDFP